MTFDQLFKLSATSATRQGRTRKPSPARLWLPTAALAAKETT